MLQRKPILEIRIEHPMSEYHIAFPAGEGSACRDSVILPDAIDNDAVKSLVTASEPLVEPWRIPIVRPPRPAGMHVAIHQTPITVTIGAVIDPIQRGDLDFISSPLVCLCKHSH